MSRKAALARVLDQPALSVWRNLHAARPLRDLLETIYVDGRDPDGRLARLIEIAHRTPSSARTELVAIFGEEAATEVQQAWPFVRAIALTYDWYSEGSRQLSSFEVVHLEAKACMAAAIGDPATWRAMFGAKWWRLGESLGGLGIDGPVDVIADMIATRPRWSASYRPVGALENLIAYAKKVMLNHLNSLGREMSAKELGITVSGRTLRRYAQAGVDITDREAVFEEERRRAARSKNREVNTVSERAASRALGVPRSTFRDLVRDARVAGVIPDRRRSKRSYLTRDDVKALARLAARGC